MNLARVGLQDFVMAVLDRQLLRFSDLLDSLDDEMAADLEEMLRRWASQIRHSYEDAPSISSAFRAAWHWPREQAEVIRANRQPVEDACDLAVRIDAFLRVLPRETPLGLLQDCRTDLSLLLILADWCEDHGQQLAAREARHLHGLVRCQLL
jgi:hypothetical protein